MLGTNHTVTMLPNKCLVDLQVISGSTMLSYGFRMLFGKLRNVHNLKKQRMQTHATLSYVIFSFRNETSVYCRIYPNIS